MSLFYRVAQSSLRAVFRILYDHKVIVKDPTPIIGGAIIASNHLSFLDPPLIAASWSEAIAFFAKADLFENPLLRTLITNLNAHPVGNGNDVKSLKLACKLLEEGNKILIFPEGTRSLDGSLVPFKRGIGMLSLRTKTPIIPTYIHGTFDIWPKGQKLPSLFGKRTVCIFGKPIFPEEFIEKDDTHIVLRVQNEIFNLQQWYLKEIKQH